MDKFIQSLDDFVTDYCEYLPEEVPNLIAAPTPIDFLNNYVMPSLPFLIRHNSPPFEGVKLWTKEYLCNCMGDKKVTVAVTPDGHADSVLEDRFMLPEERSMDLKSFLNQVDHFSGNEVFYLQKQDNNLIEEFSPLIRDAPDVEWATEAFGYLPDAANIWIGDHRSMTSMHKDHYENIYYVVSGTKTFELHPPIAMGWMPYKKCRKYQWNMNVHKEWEMKDLKEEILWIPNKREPVTQQKFRLRRKTKSYKVEVHAGQALYIPALWFHEVYQSDYCIAVNYWYDMKFDVKVPFLHFFQNLCQIPVDCSDTSVDK